MRPRVGVAMLDTRFPRLPGDIGCPASFDPPALIRRARHMGVREAVTKEAHTSALVAGFRQAVIALAADGADVIATSCGFLSPLQAVLEAAAPERAVVSSPLIDLPVIRRRLGGDRLIGVLTFDSRKLDARHLPVESGPYVVAGLEDGRELHRVISGDLPQLDRGGAEADAVEAAARLKAAHGAPAILVLECANLPPYADAIAAAVGAPTYSILDAVNQRLTMLAGAERGD